MTDLIDRYVLTVLRRIPEQQRTDIDRELRTSIEDAVEARVDGGEQHGTAVRQTLVELGDPDRLADGYTDRAQALIGPELYPIWRRLLIMLLSVVLPIVVAVTTVVQVLEDPDIGKVIGNIVTTVLMVGTNMAFWVTLVFAILERSGVLSAELRGLPARGAWTPDDLPRYEPGFLTTSQFVTALLWPVLVIAALVLQQFTFSAEPVLNPDNWTTWWPFLIVVLALEVAYAIWLFRRGAWTHAVTLANAALAVLFTVPVVWLAATERFFNPEFIAGQDWGSTDPLAWLTGIVIVIAVIGAVWDVIEVGLRAERARRGLATRVPGTGAEYTAPLG